MIAVAEQTRHMTDDEILDMVDRIDRLRARGWSMQQVADELGYASPSSLYAACRELRGIEIERYRRLCRLEADQDREPPVPTRRSGTAEMIPEERVDRFCNVVEMLQRDGLTQVEQSKAAGYGSGAGLRVALRTRRIPVEVHARISELAHERGLLEAPVTLPDFPARNSRGSWAALDYFEHLGDHLERCADLVDEAERELSTPLTQPGYDLFRNKLEELAEFARKVGG